MNKRQYKKNKKKEEMFIASWAFSYKELKKLNRSYHEYVVDAKRKKWDKVWFDKVVDEWNSIGCTSFNSLSSKELFKEDALNDKIEKMDCSVEDFKRLGYTDEEAEELYKHINIYI